MSRLRRGLFLLDAGAGEELTDLGGVLNDVHRDAADKHSEQRVVVSMGAREWPGRRVISERVEGSARPAAAGVDVTEGLGLGEHAFGKGPGVLVKGLRRRPRLKLAGEVESRQDRAW